MQGRAACEIDTADELLATELLLNGEFSGLPEPLLAALASTLIPQETVQVLHAADHKRRPCGQVAYFMQSPGLLLGNGQCGCPSVLCKATDRPPLGLELGLGCCS